MTDTWERALLARFIDVPGTSPCFICHTLTRLIEVNYEARICGAPCLTQMDQQADEAGVIWTGKGSA